MLNQTFQSRDLVVVLILVVLEALLSLDNALVLGLLARKLPPKLRSRALSYGLIGAFVFRLGAVVAAAWLLEWRIVKLLGGLYLVYIAIKHLFFEKHTKGKKHLDPHGSDANENTAGTGVEVAAESPGTLAFWMVVGSIELTDVAFAIDSILAGIALVGPGDPKLRWHPKLWVIFVGGIIGVMMMRFAAIGVIKLIEKFPRFELSGYLMVCVVGLKLCLDWIFNAPPNHDRLDFESPSAAAFWAFWGLMAVCLGVGFLPPGKRVAAG